MWYCWWTKWHWHSLVSYYFGISLAASFHHRCIPSLHLSASFHQCSCSLSSAHCCNKKDKRWSLKPSKECCYFANQRALDGKELSRIFTLRLTSSLHTDSSNLPSWLWDEPRFWDNRLSWNEKGGENVLSPQWGTLWGRWKHQQQVTGSCGVWNVGWRWLRFWVESS